MVKVNVVLVNFCDWALMPTNTELTYDEIQQAIDIAWDSNVRPTKSTQRNIGGYHVGR